MYCVEILFAKVEYFFKLSIKILKSLLQNSQISFTKFSILPYKILKSAHRDAFSL